MSLELDADGTVIADGRVVDYATAYRWCVDSPETITDLVRNTKAFAMVIAGAEQQDEQTQAAAVREAFTVGEPRSPGDTWGA